MADTTPGYAGKILRVDLTNERIWTEDITPEMSRRYLGGVGIGAKILWEEVPAHADWNHPENRLILATGPLAGLPVWGGGNMCVITRGALTNGATSTQANGFFGGNLKWSGYDAIVFQGQASRWVYLFIKDDTVELRDASSLVGKDTWATQDTLNEQLGYSGHQLSVYSIGPAGENLVRFAAIQGDYGHVASKNGVGAVMGSKKVKAVAIVKGTKGLKVADPQGVYTAADEISHDLQTDPSTRGLYEYGTLPGVYNGSFAGTLPMKNYTTNVTPADVPMERWQAPNLRNGFDHRGHQCVACGMHHCHMQVIPSGPNKGQIVDEPEYEGWASSWAYGLTDPVAASWLNTQVDKACVDVNEFGWLIAWVIECYEKGYLTKEQLGGIEAKWGDAEAADALLQMLSHRQGFGDVLAEGVKRASEHVGGPAADCAIYTGKGASPRGHDHRTRWDEMFDTCVSSNGTIETGPLIRPAELGIAPRNNPHDPDAVATSLGIALGRRHFEDSLGTCIFTTRSTLELITRALSAVTGWEYGRDEAMIFGKRTSAILRAFNMRCGVSMDSEKPSVRYGSTPVDGPTKGISIQPHWEHMLDVYYATVGYDRKTGLPTIETLRRLGLEDMIPQLWGAEATAKV